MSTAALLADSAAETLGAIGSLGPTALILIPLAFALAVVVVMAIGLVASMTGIRRFGMPGLAWTLGGVRLELHGLRSDLRAWQAGDDLAPLEPLDEHRSLFPPSRKAPTSDPAPASVSSPPSRAAAPTSRRAAEPRPRERR